MPTSTQTTVSGPAGAPEPGSHPESGTGQKHKAVVRPGDRIFSAATLIAGILILLILAGVALFLLAQSKDTIEAQVNDSSSITGGNGFFSYVWPLVIGTLISSAIALLVATPFALGIALFTTHMAPRKLAPALGYVIDLLAAIPSVVYGLWGIALAGNLTAFYLWLSKWFGWIPIFAPDANGDVSNTGRTLLTASLVLAIMILPVIAATAREVFVQTPAGHKESALALGATRWEVVKMTVLPFGFSGYISGSMLGLGRALGETMALYLVVSPSSAFRASLFDGGTTFATAIANAAPEFNDNLKAGAYIAAGLVLFLLTFVVNAGARAVIKNRSMS